MENFDTETMPDIDLDAVIRDAFPQSDDAPTAFDSDGAPLGFGPMRQAFIVTHSRRVPREDIIRDRRTGRVSRDIVWETTETVGMEPGAIEGAGGTWWVPAGAAWSVDPNAVPALSKSGRAWLKRARRNLSAVESPGETGQKLREARTACREAVKANRDDRQTHPNERATWLGVDTTTGETVLTLRCPESNARAIVEAYGKAGRVLEMRGA